MANKIDARNFKGTRDYLPQEMIKRNEMITIIRSVFEKYGFVPLETPAVEYLDILMGKYGEEGDKLIYKLDYKGGSVAGMKYDLTIPLARVMTQHNHLVLPFKRYQIQPVWRADRPQPNQGRYREFYQCDADIVGVNTMIADAEIINMIHQILSQLDIGRFVIRINHRKILSGITAFVGLPKNKEIDLCRGIDKLDKIGREGVLKELSDQGFKEDEIHKIFDILAIEGDIHKVLTELKNIFKNNEIGLQGVIDLENIIEYLKNLGTPLENIKLDLYLARGLDYYTGAIYESSSLDLPHIGSLTGGGRYDHLIQSLGGNDYPAVGTTIGLDRIATVLSQQNKITEKDSLTNVLVTIFDETSVKKSMEICSLLRKNDIKTEIYYEITKMKKQFNYADKKKIPYVVILGPEEMTTQKISIKDMSKGSQEQINQDELITYLNNKLGKNP